MADDCPKCRSGFKCPEHGGRWSSVNEPLWLFGYDRTITDKLIDALHQQVPQGYDYGKITKTKRGATFEVRLLDADGPTNRIAKVTIELDRVENPGDDAPPASTAGDPAGLSPLTEGL